MSRQIRADQPRIRVDSNIDIASGTCISDCYRPRYREARGQIGTFDGNILKCEIVRDRNIVDDDVEQAMVALPCDPKLSSDLLDWKMSVRVASRSYFIDFAHSIGDSRRGVEIQKHWQRSRYESDCLLCSGVGAVCEFESQQDVVTIVHTCERGVTQRDDRAKRR